MCMCWALSTERWTKGHICGWWAEPIKIEFFFSSSYVWCRGSLCFYIIWWPTWLLGSLLSNDVYAAHKFRKSGHLFPNCRNSHFLNWESQIGLFTYIKYCYHVATPYHIVPFRSIPFHIPHSPSSGAYWLQFFFSVLVLSFDSDRSAFFLRFSVLSPTFPGCRVSFFLCHSITSFVHRYDVWFSFYYNQLIV